MLYLRLILILLCLKFSYSGTIQGYLMDKISGNPLIGANVMLEGTSFGCSTDQNGFYLITIDKGSYNLIVSYIGYKDFNYNFNIGTTESIIYDIQLTPQALEHKGTTVTGTKRKEKITDAPASIEIISNRDIRRESTTNLGSYLKGMKGVDFTASGVDNYSISIRGFNSSVSTRLLTLTDGRNAALPALRVMSYNTLPQSSEDVEKMEVVLGPATSLYGANAHSGVVNIISKSPATSQGLNMNFSGSFDERALKKIDGRYAKKISDKLSMKLSGTYLKAYEWEYISQAEWKVHRMPWVGVPGRKIDGKDNNPWRAFEPTYIDSGLNIYGQWVRIGDGEPNHGDWDGDGLAGEDWFNGHDDDGDGKIDEDYFEADGINNFEPFEDLNSNNIADLDEEYTDINDNGIWDFGEPFIDIGNGIWDSGDICQGQIDELYGCIGNWVDIGDGTWSPAEEYTDWNGNQEWDGDNYDADGNPVIDEYIDYVTDTWYDGVDNNNNGEVDEPEERLMEENLGPHWQWGIEEKDILIWNGRELEGWYEVDNMGNNTWIENPWYIDGNLDENGNIIDKHIRGAQFWDEDNFTLLFDTYINDYGEDGIAGEPFFDLSGDSEYQIGEKLIYNITSNGDIVYTSNDYGLDGVENTNDEGENDGIWQPGDHWNDINNNGEVDLFSENFNDNNGNGFWDEGTEICQGNLISVNNQYLCDGVFVDLGNGVWDDSEPFIDSNGNDIWDAPECNGWYDSINQQCFGNWVGGEQYDDLNNNGLWDDDEEFIDNNGDGIYNDGEEFIDNSNGNFDGPEFYEDLNMNGQYDGPDLYNNDFIFDSNIIDVWPIPNGQWNDGEGVVDCGYDGLCWDYSLNSNQLQSPPEAFEDLNGDNQYNIGEPYYDWNNNGFRDNSSYIDNDKNGEYNSNIDEYYTISGPDQGENDGQMVAYDIGENDGILDTGDECYGCEGDYEQNYEVVEDTNGDGIRDIPDFEVQNRKLEFRLDYDYSEDFNFSFQSGYSWSKSQLVTGVGRYLTEGLEYSYFQFRTRYKNWFAQTYLNKLNTGNTRGYNLGNTVLDRSQDFAVQLQNHFKIREYLPLETEVVWGVDFNRTMPETFGTIINDGPNGYDNDGDSYYLQNNKIDDNGDGVIDEPGEQYVACCDGLDNNNNGQIDEKGEGVDEPDEFDDVNANQIGVYFQTNTSLTWDKKWELITSARFDYHDQIKDEGLQFGPKIGLFYNPSDLYSFRFTFGRAFNTPSTATLHTDLFVGMWNIFPIYWKGNKDGTPYPRVDLNSSNVVTPTHIIPIENINNTNDCIETTEEWCYKQIGAYDFDDGSNFSYTERVDGAPYFYNLLDGDAPFDMIPIDTSKYSIFIPEFGGDGVTYSAEETFNLSDVEPLKSEEIYSWELGFKGMITEKTILTTDYFLSHYLDFFSPARFITPMVRKRGTDQIVGFVPPNQNGLQAPYGTSWDGVDNDFDWATYAPYFGWNDDKNGDGNPIDNGEWGLIDFANPDETMNYDTGLIEETPFTAYYPYEVGFTGTSIDGEYFLDPIANASLWDAVGVDEWHPQQGLNEAEMVAFFGTDSVPGRPYAPPQILLASMNYGSVWQSGIDAGFTHIFSRDLIFDGNFSWYNSTTFYNELSKKEEPINAPKFKWNFSLKYASKFGDMALNYRHVDGYEWQDGLWSTYIDAYDIFDFHYNYKVNNHLKLSVSALNFFNNIHRELAGGAKMGRQVIFRLTSSF